MMTFRELGSKLSGLHWLAVLLSLMLTFVAWYFSSKMATEKARSAFEHEVENLNEVLGDRMREYELALISGVGAIHVNSGSINLSEWRQFSQSLALEQRLPGINGIGVILRVSPTERDAFVSRLQKEREYFSIHPTHDVPDLWPIVYIEPEQSNRAAVGLDMAHETNRYQAALKAMRTGQTQITGPIVLVQDEDRTPGFLFFRPFYEQTGTPPEDERESAFVGLVYAPFVMKKLMSGTLSESRRLLDITISDGESTLYSDAGDDPPRQVGSSSPMFEASYTRSMYGRDWHFEVETNALFDQFNYSAQPAIILIAGIVIDSLIIAMFFVMANAKSRAEKEVADRTQKLQLLNQALESQKQEAESAVTVKTAFLANMSHEIRTPMNAIIGVLSMLQDAGLDEYPKRLVTRAFDASEALLQILNDILDLSKIESDSLQLHVHEFDIDDLVKRSVDIFSLSAEAKGLRLVTDIADGVPRRFIGDLLRVSQICTNLVGNALKFTSAGSIQVRIDFVASDESHGELSVSVQDTGIGINSRDQARIFESFRQADESTSRNFGGTGLGLSISKRLAELMGGEVSLQSEEGVGSTFTLRVPVEIAATKAKRALPENSAKPARVAPQFSGLSVLVVDDVELNGEIVKSYLSSFGVESIWVEGGDAAIEAIKNHRFDLILMDLHLDGETGHDVCLRIKETPEFQASPVLLVALSASISDRDRASAKAAGMEEYLTKPVLPEDIQALLETYFPARLVDVGKSNGQSSPESKSFERLPAFIDHEAFDHQFGQNVDLFERCARSFVSGLDNWILEREHALDETSVRTLSHKIRGAAFNLADTTLAKKAERLEKTATDTNSQAYLDDLMVELKDHAEWLSGWLDTREFAERPDIDAGSLKPVLEKVRNALRQHRIIENADSQFIGSYLRSTGRGHREKQFITALELYEFETALRILDEEFDTRSTINEEL